MHMHDRVYRLLFLYFFLYKLTKNIFTQGMYKSKSLWYNNYSG
nr:hypothetical protein YXRTKSLT_YXRTKSLT_CDS_0073 [uncultured phage]CAI9752512.1 hypothetical protein IPSYOLDY_IPSYOLDY_CDS_0073 [uncultured phage]